MDGTANDWVEADNTAYGVVRWFDPYKGYGFILSDQIEGDVLLHHHVLESFGQNSASEGCQIEFRYKKGPSGLKATLILSLRSPFADLATNNDGVTDLSDTVPARVSWFDPTRGFGFVHDFWSGQEIFLHANTLKQCGLTQVHPGEALRVQTSQNSHGQVVTAVYPWFCAHN